MFYDQDGTMKVAGAEADSSAILDLAEDENWTKAELLVLIASLGCPIFHAVAPDSNFG
jgi:hypothetical protein